MERKRPSDYPQDLLDLFYERHHGFHNDATPLYDEESPKLAWTRSLEIFNKNLR